MKRFNGAKLPAEGDILLIGGVAFHILSITNNFIYAENCDGEIQVLTRDDFSFDAIEPLENSCAE